MRAVLIAAALCAGLAPVRADDLVGKWKVEARGDRFGDGATYIASTGTRDAPLHFVVRCIRGRWSFALVGTLFAPGFAEGAAYPLKFRVDDRPVREVTGLAISRDVIDMPTPPVMVADVLAGKLASFRITSPIGAQQDMTFRIRKARLALTNHLKACPAVD